VDVPGGISGIIVRATESGHMNLYDWRPSLTEMTVGVVVVSYFFNFLHDYGVDQLTVQRLLTVRDYRAMAWATMVNAVITVLALSLLAFIGLGMYAYYAARPGEMPDAMAGDRIFPHFIMAALPAGAASFVLSGFFAAAMSSLDSGINSAATVVVNDFVRPLRTRPLSERSELRLARRLTLALGVLTTAMAFYAASLGSLLASSQVFLGLFSGPVLALFLLGMLTRRGCFEGWCIGVAPAVPLTYAVQRYTEVHFIYYFPLSFLTCFIIGYAASSLFPAKAPAGSTVWGQPSRIGPG
jgi:Na+/proline symporter